MTFLGRFTVLAPYLVATVVALVVGVLLWRGRRALEGRGPFALLMFSIALWAFFNFMEDGTDVLAAKFAYANLQYLFIGSVPVLFLAFSLQATRAPLPRWWTKGPLRYLIGVPPVIVAVLSWFDLEYGIVRVVHGLQPAGEFTVLDRTWTPVFWAFTAYCYAWIAAALVFWARYIFTDLGTPRRTEVLPFLVVFLPWSANIAFVLGFNPWPGHDPTPPLFAVMGLVIALHLGKSRVFTLLPEAQETLMQTWAEPMLVITGEGRLRYGNNQAQSAWGLDRTHLGQTIDAAEPWMASLLPVCSETQTLRDEGRRRVWRVESRFLGNRGTTGSLLIFHDVTDDHQVLAEQSTALESAYSQISMEQDTQRRNEEQIFFYSLHDSLTALANRNLLLSRLGQAIDRSHSGGTSFSLVAIDVVNLRGVNDSLGYQAGDNLIRLLAQRLKASLRDGDVPARTTADRFFALLAGTDDPATVLPAVFRIQAQLEQSLVLGQTAFIPKCRMAVVLAPTGAPSPESVMDDAEFTLGRIREEQLEPVLVFQPAWRQHRQETRILLEDLTRAFGSRQISLVYQPIVTTSRHQVEGFEALIRWNHPTLGSISPDRMVALAEAEGLIAPLGLWTLREASAFMKRLVDGGLPRPDTFVSVNVSPKQLRDPEFCRIVLAILATTDLAPRHLHLEITESSVVTHAELVIPQLQALRQAGVKIKLDDFGTGYSSLQSLHELPIDTLKIDRAFVVKLPESRPIVRTVLDLAGTLGLDTIAEGVDSLDALAELKSLGCEKIQGFLFSQGLPETDLLTILQETPEWLLTPHPEL
jgi:diguanylate cyclase (GGDEF)-like protein